MSKGYDTWEELIAEESNGWVFVSIVSNGKQTWPWVEGPFLTKREAENARVSARKRFKKPSHRHLTAKFFVRPAWKRQRFHE